MRLQSFFHNPGIVIFRVFTFVVWLFAPAMNFEFMNWGDPEHRLDNPLHPGSAVFPAEKIFPC
ncbi:MAG TPA: hypothetical protein PLT76_10625 [Candidatus Omnitrophota bacterium]|nr:hypothetical protein [Candidatus Omnitrophota bacterium]HQO59153.1 hypothetical protein [Candidatus Omnitrophota bacterium]